MMQSKMKMLMVVLFSIVLLVMVLTPTKTLSGNSYPGFYQNTPGFGYVCYCPNEMNTCTCVYSSGRPDIFSFPFPY